MRPCKYREALDDGRIICEKITEGNPEVNPNICRRCPVAKINCEHLRFTLRKAGHKPIVVRYGNGVTEVWDENPPSVEFVRGACAEKVMPISGSRDCAGCQVRCPVWETPLPDRVPANGATVVASAGNVIRFPSLDSRDERPVSDGTTPLTDSRHTEPTEAAAAAR